MRFWAILAACVSPVIGSTSCSHYNVTSGAHPGGVDMYMFKSDRVMDPSDVVHCTTLWPNQDPELAVYPVPPGCMRLNPRAGKALNVSNTLKINNELGRLVHVEWTPEWEFPNDPEWGDQADPAQRMSIPVGKVLCEKYYSKTTFGSSGRVIVVGEGCAWMHRDACKFLGEKKSSSTCARSSENTHFMQPTGFHRTLFASISGNARHSYDAFQWLPRQWFAEIDELERKTLNMSQSVSWDVNIENPSAISPAQVILVRDYPIPVHSRVNPPLKDGSKTHFVVKIPDAIWMTAGKAEKDCAVETIKLIDLAQVAEQHRLQFARGRNLVRTKSDVSERQVSVLVPTGKSEDLFQVVSVTAVTAIIGAAVIVLASVI